MAGRLTCCSGTSAPTVGDGTAGFRGDCTAGKQGEGEMVSGYQVNADFPREAELKLRGSAP
ncbi:hypothetical protein GCM10009665_51880 [Kitasatospora nipponensis]|uniref:Uncharacterized protein n=1 Tax=Kitasatospora nipponensis TaxID=258049 RepID=A0ABN1WLZ7_9ACTN